MKRLIVLCLIATCAVGASLSLSRADDKPAVAEKKQSAKPKHVPFRGKIGTLDKSAGTLKIGERTFHVSSTTKITKAAKPATLEDAAVGEEVSGAYHQGEEGQLEVSTMRIGPKPPKDEPKEDQ